MSPIENIRDISQSWKERHGHMPNLGSSWADALGSGPLTDSPSLDALRQKLKSSVLTSRSRPDLSLLGERESMEWAPEAKPSYERVL